VEGIKPWLRDVVPPIALILAIDLAVTIVFFGVSGGHARVGTLRPVNAIPGKALELVLVGSGIGLVACLAAGRLDINLLTLAIGFVALLDVDHLPSVFGVEQPIRPTHSFAFLAVEVVSLLIAFRGRPELAVLAVSAFLGHVAGDTGIFALFAPFSFVYGSIDAYRVAFGIVAVAFALATGSVSRRTARASRMRVSG
jgi:hypothetical protein